MTEEFTFGARLRELVDKVVKSYEDDARTQHIDKMFLPSRAEIIQVTEELLELTFPGLVGRQHLTEHNVSFHVGDLLPRIGERLFRQIHMCLCYVRESESSDRDVATKKSKAEEACEQRAHELTLEFLESIPDIRSLLAGDVQAAYDGDPAAVDFHEVILAYPGVFAIAVQRMAHRLYQMRVPLMPRIMAEWVHNETGIDIHPGANIGRNFFIDHGTGVVIGETTDIGENVKIYQGVTLGALSFAKDERGRVIRETKRHPTVGDNVTIYANAIILGGETVIGDNSVVGGSVFVTSSVPPESVVTFKPPELRMKSKIGDPPPKENPPDSTSELPDYSI